MVAMGGGPETPQRGDDQKRELLLCVQPLPETAIGNVVNEIKEEFPNLELQFHHYEGGELKISEGRW